MKEFLPALAVVCCLVGCQSASTSFKPPFFAGTEPVNSYPDQQAMERKLSSLENQLATMRQYSSPSPAARGNGHVQLASLVQPAGAESGAEDKSKPPVPLSGPMLRFKDDTAGGAEEKDKKEKPDTKEPEKLQPTIVEGTLPSPGLVEYGTPQPGYDLAGIEQMALASNPTYAQFATRVQALQGKWVQVGLGPNPNVGYVGNDIGNEATAGQQGAFVSQQFVLGNKLELNRTIAAREIAQAQHDLSVQQQRILTDVRIAYYTVVIAQRKQQLTKELVKVGEKAVTASKALLEAEEINRVQLLQAQVETDNLRLLADQAANETEAAWRRLESVVGASQLDRVPLQGDTGEHPNQIVWADSLENILAQSPELAAAAANVDRARASYDRAVVQPIPNVTGQLSVQHDGETDFTVVGVQIGIPLPLFDKNQGRINQTRNEIAIAQRNVARLRLNLKQRFAMVYQNYVNAELQSQRYSRDILPRAKETLDLVTEGYAAGEEIDYLTLLTAQRTFFRTRLAQIEAQRTLWTTTSEIQGLLLRNSLQQEASSNN